MTIATAQPDRAWVMHRAWYYVRISCRRPAPIELKYALRNAWADYRAKQRGLRLVDELTAREKALATLEAKTFTTPADRDEIAVLRTAIAQEHAAPALAAKRALIEAAPCVVTFTKADGTLRTMRVEPGKLLAKGAAATKAGQRATKSRKARHPNLLPVWDADKDAPRNVNLATVSRIATPERVHTF